jgi:hypothetical protein
VKRPQLDALITFVREGDTIYCHSMDRLGRNLDDLRKLVPGLNGRGIQIRFLKENLTFKGDDSPMANLLLNVMGAFAQFERELIRERQREGIEIAKRTGVYKGRKRTLTLIILLLCWIPFGAVIGILLPSIFHTFTITYMLAVAYTLYTGYVWLQYGFYSCPNCGLNYRGRQLWRRTCPKCSIEINLK